MSSNRFMTFQVPRLCLIQQYQPKLPISRFGSRPRCCSHVSETLKAFLSSEILGQMDQLTARWGGRFGQVSFYRSILSILRQQSRGSSLFLLQFLTSMAALWVWMILLSLLQMAHSSVTNRHVPGKPRLFLEVTTMKHTYLTCLL